MLRIHAVGSVIGVALLISTAAAAGEPRDVSGVYPQLAMFNEEGECGTGAVVPWAGRLWVITYGPHLPKGSSDKLYEITPELQQIVRPESIGGTCANRMIHRESQQLFLGPYVIDRNGAVRAIPFATMYGRHTGLSRHLTDPANKICYATMEEGCYEVDVQTLAVKELWADEQLKPGRHSDLPGYHGKGFYSGQGHYVYANNGEHGTRALSDPATPSGVLAEWDGRADRWTIVRRNQFTDVTGPSGIEGGSPELPLWSIGWDHRSLILMLRDRGVWHSFRLPKASHTYDGAHGWNTEWPRIREIGEDTLLMTMHGSFWKFPRGFSAANTAGLAPRSTYLKVVGDFCRWNDRLVLGCDDTAKSEFLNKSRIKGTLAAPGISQSNLWFLDPARLDACGPPLGRGAVWLRDDVKAGTASEPFLFSGYAQRSLHLTHQADHPVTFTLEIDAQGNGSWTRLRNITVPSHGHAWTAFAAAETGAWVRLTSDRDAAQATAFFHYRADDNRGSEDARLTAGLATIDDQQLRGGLLHVRGNSARTLRCLTRNAAGELGSYDLDAALTLRPADDVAGTTFVQQKAAIPPPVLTVDAASVLFDEGPGRRWRLPKGPPAFDHPGPLGPERVCREVCTERNLLNVHGTFYELPAENAGGFIKVRPIATHNRRIYDFASYRGLLVLSGVTDGAQGNRLRRSTDGQCAVWVGVVDDVWRFGKPRGAGGPWRDTAVTADEPSDAYLATGYDRKRLTLSHTSGQPVSFRVEADFTGTGVWAPVITLSVKADESREHHFPPAFGAYWLRLVADRNTTATATFTYE